MADENLQVLDSQDQVSPVSPEQQVQEKMLPQSQVNKIVSREVHEARDKIRRETQAEIDRLNAQLAESKNSVTSSSSMGGMRQDSPDDIRRLIADETQKVLNAQRDEQIEHLRMEQGQRIANEFVQKMEVGKTKYPDFDKVVGEIDFRTMPEIVHLTHNLDNAADVVYDLMKHPQKVANILTLSGRNELLARKSLQELSDSIKVNQKASQSPSSTEPLSQISPSTVGMDNGSMTIDDYRAQPWLRV